MKALELASVASMIDLFNMDNIDILKRLGYQVDVACNFEYGSITSDKRVKEFKEELIKDGINVYNIPIPRSISKLSKIIDSYKYVKKICEENNYKIVHCHSPIGGVVARLACRKVRKKGTKIIYTAHGFHFFKGAPLKNWIIFYPVEKFCSRFTDCIITINQEDYKRAKTKFHAESVKFIPGIGVDTKKFNECTVSMQQKRYDLNLANDDFVFISVGQISKRKNHEVVIRALAKINNVKVKYIIVGFGELEEYLENIVKELKLEDRVIFLGYRNDISELLYLSDAFAFPSLQEGLPVSLMEAMASGLPIVCSKIRGNVDLIEHGVNGYLYKCDDIDGFAYGMELISSMEVYEIKKISLNNRIKAQNYDVRLIHNEMVGIYKNVINGKEL